VSVRCCTRREALLTFSASVLALALPGLAGCGGREAPEPPEVAIDQDVCDWCRMAIDDRRLAAAFVPASGRPLRFGEPGCLLAWLAEHRGTNGAPFVAAWEDGGWLPATTAAFGRGVRTPMRFDIAAWRGEPGPDLERLTWSRLLEEGAPRARRD
jgi:hypothetical protein